MKRDVYVLQNSQAFAEAQGVSSLNTEIQRLVAETAKIDCVDTAQVLLDCGWALWFAWAQTVAGLLCLGAFLRGLSVKGYSSRTIQVAQSALSSVMVNIFEIHVPALATVAVGWRARLRVLRHARAIAFEIVLTVEALFLAQ